MEAPQDGVSDNEGVMLEEEVFVLLYALRSQDLHISVRNRPQQV